MKAFRYVIAIAILCGFSGLAKADTLDFKMNVLDPPSLPYAEVINSMPFPISFSTCAAGELPSGVTANGCFAGFNDTTQTWTNLQFTFVNSTALGGQPASCGSPGSAFSIFTVTSCSLSGSTYVLTFTNGVIIPGETFVVAEAGADPSAFGTGSGTTIVPEPNSLLLLSTGVMLFGLLAHTGRRRTLRSSLLR